MTDADDTQIDDSPIRDVPNPPPYLQGDQLENGHIVIAIEPLPGAHPAGLTGFIILAMPNDGNPRAHAFATWWANSGGMTANGRYLDSLGEGIVDYNERLGRKATAQAGLFSIENELWRNEQEAARARESRESITRDQGRARAIRSITRDQGKS